MEHRVRIRGMVFVRDDQAREYRALHDPSLTHYVDARTPVEPDPPFGGEDSAEVMALHEELDEAALAIVQFGRKAWKDGVPCFELRPPWEATPAELAAHRTFWELQERYREVRTALMEALREHAHEELCR